VTDVLENSPAAEAGLLKDDQILKVNDKEAKALSVTKLAEMLERPGTYRLTIRRGEKTLDFALTTRKLI